MGHGPFYNIIISLGIGLETLTNKLNDRDPMLPYWSQRQFFLRLSQFHQVAVLDLKGRTSNNHLSPTIFCEKREKREIQLD